MKAYRKRRAKKLELYDESMFLLNNIHKDGKVTPDMLDAIDSLMRKVP